MFKLMDTRVAVCLALLVGAVSTSATFGPAAQDSGFVVAWAHEVGTSEDEPIRTQRFDTLQEAAVVATGGRVALGDQATIDDFVAALDALDLSDASTLAASATTIGIDYSQAGYSGSFRIWSVPNSVGCSTGLTYYANTMPPGWDDRVSSAVAAGGCASFTHYSGTYQTGMNITCNCTAMGAMDNRTRSERWTQW